MSLSVFNKVMEKQEKERKARREYIIEQLKELEKGFPPDENQKIIFQLVQRWNCLLLYLINSCPEKGVADGVLKEMGHIRRTLEDISRSLGKELVKEDIEKFILLEDRDDNS